MVGHCPPDYCPRAQIQHHGEIQPAFACRKVGHIPDVDGIWLWHHKLPLEAVRSYCLGLPYGQRRFEFAPGFVAETRPSQHPPDAAATDLQPFLRQQMLDPARPVGATALRKTLLTQRSVAS